MMGEIRTSVEAAEDHAMPRRHDAHSEAQPGQDGDQTAQLTSKPVKAKSPAEWAYERLIIYIQNFEKIMDAEHEVAIGFTGSDAGVMRIEGMGFFDPDIITFYGSEPDGSRTQLVQHVSQLNVMLRALPKPKNAVAPQRIGFRLAAELEEKTRGDGGAGVVKDGNPAGGKDRSPDGSPDGGPDKSPDPSPDKSPESGAGKTPKA